MHLAIVMAEDPRAVLAAEVEALAVAGSRIQSALQAGARQAVRGLRSGAAARQDAELVPLRVGKYDPALIALADVGVPGTQAEQAADLFVLPPVGWAEVEVEAVLTVLPSGKDSCFKVPNHRDGHVTMTTNDTATRRVTTGIMLAVGLFAGSDSYSHIYTLARDHGQAIASAALLPLAGDGLIAAASSAMLVASRQGRDVPVLARVMLLAGIGATIAANVGYGLHAGLTGALLSVWPVAAYVGCMELLTWMRRNTGMHPAVRPASGDVAADAADELARRRHSTGGLLEAAGRAFPAAGAGNVPSLREIQRALRVGQGKAQQVQAHLAGRPADVV